MSGFPTCQASGITSESPVSRGESKRRCSWPAPRSKFTGENRDKRPEKDRVTRGAHMPGAIVRLKGVECRPERVKGDWSRGYALDEHTVSSITVHVGTIVVSRK